MGMIAGYNTPRDHEDFIKAMEFWLLDNFEVGLNNEGPRANGTVAYDLDFRPGVGEVYVVVAKTPGDALGFLLAALSPEELAAVAGIRDAGRRKGGRA